MIPTTACLETNRGDVISGFHESARDFCREACLVFDPQGVHMYGTDSVGIVRVQYSLSADAIRANNQGNYICNPSSMEVDIDTKIVASCLSGVSCGDLVGFSIDMDNEPDRLVIKCQNTMSGKRSCYRVIIPEPPEEPVLRESIESGGYNSELVMGSLLFHDMLRDLTKSDDNSVRVCCDGKRLVLLANGRYVKAAFEVRVGTDDSHFVYNPKPTDRWPVCECFSISFLQKVAKAKGVSQNISLHLKPNHPISFEYKTTIGSLGFTISPRDDLEWIENPTTRVMPAPSDDIDGIIPRQRSNGSKKRHGSHNASFKKQEKYPKQPCMENHPPRRCIEDVKKDGEEEEEEEEEDIDSSDSSLSSKDDKNKDIKR